MEKSKQQNNDAADKKSNKRRVTEIAAGFVLSAELLAGCGAADDGNSTNYNEKNPQGDVSTNESTNNDSSWDSLLTEEQRRAIEEDDKKAHKDHEDDPEIIVSNNGEKFFSNGDGTYSGENGDIGTLDEDGNLVVPDEDKKTAGVINPETGETTANKEVEPKHYYKKR